jgi:hypothetical protein
VWLARLSPDIGAAHYACKEFLPDPDDTSSTDPWGAANSECETEGDLLVRLQAIGGNHNVIRAVAHCWVWENVERPPIPHGCYLFLEPFQWGSLASVLSKPVKH